MLGSWAAALDNENCGTHVPLVYILEHGYSEANVCLDHLKGKDKLRGRYLADACRDQGFCLFLAPFQHAKPGGCDEEQYNIAHISFYHEIYGLNNYQWVLDTIFTSDGKQLAYNMAVGEKDVVQADLLDPAEPDDEEYEGWTGNEGANAPHSYHRSCPVLVPRAHHFDFLEEAANEGNANILAWIDMLIQEMGQEPTGYTSKEELEKLCSQIIATNTCWLNSPERK